MLPRQFPQTDPLLQKVQYYLTLKLQGIFDAEP
jgi:hypothetical protein